MNPKVTKQKYPPFDRDRVVIRAARTADSPDLQRLIRAYYRFDHIRFEPPRSGKRSASYCAAHHWDAHGSFAMVPSLLDTSC
jgi:hypothetical protein